MKLQRFRRTKAALQGGAIALVIAALVFSIATHVMSRSTSLSGFDLTASSNFAITSSISSSSSAQVAATLEPGVQRYLWYTVHNSLLVPITVSTLSVPNVTPPAGCPASNLDISGATFSGSLVVPARVGAVAGTNSVAVPISLAVNPSSQSACKNATFNFTFSGTATYTEVYATSTGVVSSLNPSNIGQGVTYTATVTATVGANQDPVPSSPSGKVTFKDGSTTICADVSIASASSTTSTAQCSPSAYSAAGTHVITAVFTNTDGNFSSSTSSPALNQVVQSGHTATATVLTSTPNPSMFGSSVTLTATVTKSSGSGTPAGTVSLYSGTPTGSHTLLGSGTLNSSGKATYPESSLPAGSVNLYAAYGGDAHFGGSTSPVVSQLVIAVPSGCIGSFALKVGSPSFPIVTGTNGNDFIYAVGGSFLVNGLNGNDCLSVGNGNNIITDGSGNDVVLSGNGNSLIVVGNGNDKITVGNGANGIIAGNGNNTVTLGTGSHNTVTLGSGNNTVFVQSPGNHDSIFAGKGNNTIFLGTGTFNTFNGGSGHNVCHLPTPPSSWHGNAAAYYHDTIVNCTVVTP